MHDSQHAVQNFLEAAGAVILQSATIDTQRQEELYGIGKRMGLGEQEVDGVLQSLQAKGVVRLETCVASATSVPESRTADADADLGVEPPEGKTGASANRPDAPAGVSDATSEAPAEPVAESPSSSEQLARDMLRARVDSLLESQAVIDTARRASLLQEATELGLPTTVAVALLRELLPIVPPPPPLGAEPDVAVAELDDVDDPSDVSQAALPGGPLPAAPDSRPPAGATSRGADEDEILWVSIDESVANSTAGQCGERETAGPSSSDSSPNAAAPPADSASATAPLPPPFRRTPSERYRRYLGKAIPQLRRDRISVRSENKLLREGIEKLGIFEPLARELLWVAADELGIPVESRQRDAQSAPAVAEFLRRAQPILAEHRGVNLKSRVLLDHLGEALGLTPEEVQRALTFGAEESGEGEKSLLADAKRQGFEQVAGADLCRRRRGTADAGQRCGTGRAGLAAARTAGGRGPTGR